MGWQKTPNFKERVDNKATKYVRGVAMQVLRGVVVRTPVDTGRLRGNWQTGVGSAPGGEGYADKSGAYTEAASRAALAAVNTSTKNIYIVNNLPYAVPIEDGHGGRNPGVMVAATLSVLKNKGVLK